MNYNLILTVLVNGLAMGMVYALISMGLILMFRSAGVMNFAQGNMLALGAFLAYWLLEQMKMPLGIAIPVCVIFFALVGLLFMLCIYLPLKDTTVPVAIVVATMGASVILREACQLIWGALPLKVRSIMIDAQGEGLTISFFGSTFAWQYLIIAVLGLILILLVNALFEKTYVGKMMEATAQDKSTAVLIGTPTLICIAITYMIAISMGCIGGFLVGPIFYVSNGLSSLQLRAFAAVVMGGTGNIKGAVISALLIGVFEALITLNFSAYKDVFVFGMLIIVLVIRPTGLFKAKIGDKA